MTLELRPLPYAEDALEPHLSAATMRLHHGKHHKKYVDTLNKLIAGTELESKPLLAIIGAAAADPAKIKIFNNAGQAWNHDFFWNSLSPQGGGKPAQELLQRLERDFGGFDAFKKAFKDAAIGQFGSGWAWLVDSAGHLRVMATRNAITPVVFGKTPLITCDVWEHAYYLDYRNRRGEYVDAFLDHMANWEFAMERLEKADRSDVVPDLEALEAA